MSINIEPVAWTVCCDFHIWPEDIKVHLDRWALIYGKDLDGNEIGAPDGWVVLPFRARLPNGRHKVFDGYWGSGEWRDRACASTMTPIFARPHSPWELAFAVPRDPRLVEVTCSGDKFKRYVDPDTGQIVTGERA